MFREFCAPSDHRRDKRGVKGFFMFAGQDGTLTSRLQIEAGAKQEGIKEGKSCMDDLKVNFDKVQGESRSESVGTA